jgi:predicted subunit of tRNA(5-methylaminomethyl-2-thiouridylate) methyltransferase
MQAVVIGPFITPMEATPPKTIVRPSANADEPMVVELPAAYFARQCELGNVTSLEAFNARRKARKEADRRRMDLELEVSKLEARALMDVESRALIEDFEALDGMDKDHLVELALRRKLNVNTRRSEDILRRDVRGALEPLVAKARGVEAEAAE